MNKKAFTLIEISVYITLIAGILVTATSFAWNVINDRTKSFVTQEVEQNGRFIMEKISQTVRQSENINTPVQGADGQQLSLVMSDAAIDPTIFEIDNGLLVMKRGMDPAIALSTDSVEITYLTFKNLSSPDGRSLNVSISLGLRHVNPDNRQAWEYTRDFTTSVELRNF